MGRLWQHPRLHSRKLIKQTGFILIVVSILSPVLVLHSRRPEQSRWMISTRCSPAT